MSSLDQTADDIFQSFSNERPRLLGFIKKRTNNIAEIEDIYQEAVMRVTKQLRAGGKPADPIGYLYRITANIINDNYRRQRGVDMSEPLTDDILCQRPLPDQHLEAQQRLKLFVEYLNTLPAITRNIIVMRKLHGKNYTQIANELDMNPKAVEKQLNRALRLMEENMTKHVLQKKTSKKPLVYQV